MIQFLANENIPIGSIKLLRKSGYDVLSILEEMPGAKDSDILRKAYDENRIILTFDRDYGELIYRYKLYPPGGIVYFRFKPADPEEPSKILLSILENSNVSILGKFTVVERNRVRQRALKY